jgi:hypothetical protein
MDREGAPARPGQQKKKSRRAENGSGEIAVAAVTAYLVGAPPPPAKSSPRSAATLSPRSVHSQASSAGVSPDDYLERRWKDARVDERQNGRRGATSGGKQASASSTPRDPPGASAEAKREEHSKKRFRAILSRKKKHREHRKHKDDRGTNDAHSGRTHTSFSKRIRRILFPSSSKKKRGQDAGQSCQNHVQEDLSVNTERKNPYARPDKDKGNPWESGSLHGRPRGPPLEAIYERDDDITEIPPSLVMTPNFKDHGGSIELSSSSDRLSSSPNDDLDTKIPMSGMSSSSHHLLKISEHDVLSDRDIAEHSAHSELANDHAKGGLKGDLIRHSAHSEGTNTTGMMTITTHHSLGRSHSPSKSPVFLSTDDKARLLSLPLPISLEGTSSEVEQGSLRGSLNSTPTMGLTMSALSMNDDTTHIINLPWSYKASGDINSDSSKKPPLHGKYTGPVNDSSFQPHGEGALVIQAGSQSLTFYGRWNDGLLVSPLDVDPPGRDSCNVSHVSLEGREGSMFGDLPDSPILPTQTGDGRVQGIVATKKKTLDIKYLVNRCGDVQDMVRTNNRKHPKWLPSYSLRYTLGEACRTPIDMVIHRSKQKAIQSAALLRKWDQVFIKRSTGVWTVAVMVDRALQPKSKSKKRQGKDQDRWRTVWEIDPKKMELEECMLFAIDDDGATKIVNRKSWAKYVRRIKA